MNASRPKPETSEQIRLDPLALASMVSGKARLETLVQKSASFGPTDPPKADFKEDGFALDVRQSISHDGTSLQSDTEFRLIAPSLDADGEFIEIRSRFLLAYVLPEGCEFLPESLDAFGKLNGVYNAWPYWREYVQQSLYRMGFPSLSLPLLTAPGAVRLAGLKVKRD